MLYGTTALKPHPVNQKLYGAETIPQDFIDSIKENGILEPLVIKRDGTIISGHRRWLTAKALNMESVPVRVLEFENELDEREAIITFNKQREKTFSQKMAEAEELEAIERERARKRQVASLKKGEERPVRDKWPEREAGRTRDKVAQAVGMGSGKTYERAAKVWEAAKKGNEVALELVEKLDKGEVSIHKAHEYIRRQDTSIFLPTNKDAEKAIQQAAVKPHVAYNSGNNEWYTPMEYIEAAKRVMGVIDLDPASCAIANEAIGATRYYDAEANGLEHPWEGRVWLNPPYSSDLIGHFCKKLVGEFTAGRTLEAIVLVNNATETGWFSTLVEAASAVVFPKGRVKFWGPDGQGGAPLQGQAVLYFGRHPAKFMTEFHGFGWGAYL